MGTWMRLSLSCALAWICCCTAFLEDKDLYLEGVEFSRTFDGYYIGPIHADQQHYIGDLVHDLDSYQHERETISTDCSEFECNITVKCLSSRNLVQLWENGIAKDEQVVALCPDVIRDEASKSCNVLVEKENEWNITTSYLKPTQSEVWGYGILSLVIITSCSVTGMLLLPIMSKDFYRKILVFFVSLGVGSLCGNSVFNLIPQALELFKDESQAYLWKMLLVACGIYMFFLTDRIMKFHMKVKQKKRTARKLRALLQGDDSSSTTERLSAMNPTEEELDPMYNHSIAMPLDQAQKKHGHEHIPFGDEDQTIATVAWMIMFGDSMHKIVDGLSIGAAFSDSIWVGISITLAVFCEEFPHELGDFAIFLNAGMTVKQAVTFNLLSALTCFLGLIVGIQLGSMANAHVYIFSFSAGMFFYISLSALMPEMTADLEEAIEEGNGFFVFCLQNLGILTGGTIMFVMALYGGKLTVNAAGT